MKEEKSPMPPDHVNDPFEDTEMTVGDGQRLTRRIGVVNLGIC